MLRRRKGLMIALLAIALMAVGGGGYYYYTTIRVSAQAAQEPAIQTTRVRTGDLILSATGAGTVIAAEEISLAFETGGTLVEVNGQAGDRVKQGDVLARIDDLNARKALISAQLALAKAQSDLETAREDHQTLLAGPSDAEVLDASAAVKSAQEKLDDLLAGPTEAEIAEAEAALAAAQEAYDSLVNGPDALELEQKQLALQKARNSLWAAQLNRDAKGSQRDKDSGAYDQAQVSVLNAEISVREAEMSLNALQASPSQAEVKQARAKVTSAQKALAELRQGASEAELASAQAQLAKAQKALDELLASPTQQEIAFSEAKVRQAELNLAQAELALESAQRDLEATALRAPIDGTIMSISGKVGERAGSSAIVTLADLTNPLLEIFVDETDMDKIAVGYEVEVVLDAMPDEVFKGRVIQVNPSLVTEGGMKVIRGLVALDGDSFAKPQGLPMGLNATVDIIGGKAMGALLVPVEALRELGPNEYAVFVVEDGKPKLRTVEVGLMDYTYAEIRSGLQAGEVVSTGLVETR